MENYIYIILIHIHFIQPNNATTARVEKTNFDTLNNNNLAFLYFCI